MMLCAAAVIRAASAPFEGSNNESNCSTARSCGRISAPPLSKGVASATGLLTSLGTCATLTDATESATAVVNNFVNHLGETISTSPQTYGMSKRDEQPALITSLSIVAGKVYGGGKASVKGESSNLYLIGRSIRSAPRLQISQTLPMTKIAK